MIRVPVAERDKSDDQMQSQRIDFSRLEIPEIRVEFPVIQRSIADLLAKNNRFNPSVENKNAIIGASKTQLPVEIWLMIVSIIRNLQDIIYYCFFSFWNGTAVQIWKNECPC